MNTAIRGLISAAGLIACSALSACTTPAFDGQMKPPVVARIALSPGINNAWVATYILPAPVSELVFMRQPNDSRTKDWKPGPGLELVRIDGKERLRRTDGQPLREAIVSVPAAYRDLPMDYAPFSPFGDGGLLAYTGRFFACPTDCAEDAKFQIVLSASGQTILVDGVRHKDQAAWTDSAEGRNVYIGSTTPVETPDFLAVIDAALPGKIRTQLAAQLPGFMHYFAGRMGALHDRPMLFASYDIRPADGFGRQGGTLPGQVFVHFYGEAWPQEMAKPGFADDLAWHFAHEAAHLYQSQLFVSDSGAWIHEGGADAFAAIAMRAQGHAAAADAHIADAARTCHDKVAGRSIAAALQAGEHQVAYACGLQINLALDAELRRISPMSDGLFSVWREYRAAVAGRPPTAEDFFAAIAKVGGADTAAFVREAISATGPSGDGTW